MTQTIPANGPASESAPIYCPSPDVLACPLADGLALFDPRSNDYFSLNRSGAIVWNRAREGAPASELRAAVASSFGKAEAEIRSDVDTAIAALIGARLLTVRTPDHTLSDRVEPCRDIIAPMA